MKSRNIRKYLAYAAGEILLVVVGILIALQFNDADLDRQDRKREKAFMAAMLGDLEKDVRNIDVAVEANQILLDGLDELLILIAEQPQSTGDQRKMYLWSLKNTYWYLTSDFSEGVLSQLKYSGGFQLIEDQGVVDAILRYDQGIMDCRHQFEEMVNYFHAVEARQKDLFDLSLGKKAYEFIEQDYMNMLLPAAQFEGLIDEGAYLLDPDSKTLKAYYGDVLFYRTTINNTNAFMMMQKELAGSLSRLIRERYQVE